MSDTLFVVMGDLVRSEAAASTRALHAQFNVAVDAANLEFAGRLASPLTITLGDEFQGLCGDLATGLDILRHIRWRLLENSVSCRFVVGQVTLETPLNEARAWNMMGPGLGRAREKLEQKRDPNAYRFSLPDHPALEALMDGVGLALTDLEAGWTERQREVTLASFRGHAASVIAERLRIRESVFYKIRRAAKFDLYSALWSKLQEASAVLDAERRPS